MTTTFETAEVGDRVWCLLYGWQTIVSTNFNINYPIATNKGTYTYEGKVGLSSQNRTLFWDEIVITPPSKPAPKLEVDTKVLVWDNSNCIKRKGHFSHFDEKGKMHVFAGGTTSWSHKEIIPYNYWELAKD